MKAHEKIGPVGRQLCMLFDGIVIGSGAQYLADDKAGLNLAIDIDIVIPIDRWVQASKLIPGDAKPNSFGGFKFNDNGVITDVWADDACRIFWMNRTVNFYALRTGFYVIQK